MTWEELHQQDDFTQVDLTDEQTKWLAILSHLDRATVTMMVCSFNQEKMEQFDSATKIAEALSDIFGDVEDIAIMMIGRIDG